MQVHSEDLAAVLGIVMAHQAPALKSALVLRLLSALVLPDPEHYRAHLRRLAALEGALTITGMLRKRNCTLMCSSGDAPSAASSYRSSCSAPYEPRIKCGSVDSKCCDFLSSKTKLL